MKSETPVPRNIRSLSTLHQINGLPPPEHPLISLIDHSLTPHADIQEGQQLTLPFYNITIKRNYKGALKYGGTHYDFDSGMLSFTAPGQTLELESNHLRSRDGWSLLFHPDLIREYELAKLIRTYNFFDYALNEALHVSAAEDKVIEDLSQMIRNAYRATTDLYSQDIIVSSIEVLLHHCRRYYDRQFLTRKIVRHDLLTRFELALSKSFTSGGTARLPTVKMLADELEVSPGYLGDMLRAVTGQNAQQHIHAALIRVAKELLIGSTLTVSEIAYQLGFERPQSFNKLFKSKAGCSPLQYRRSLN